MNSDSFDLTPKPKRLQAYLASAGLGSRRHCEAFILEGRVLINGQKAELGQSVSPGDTVLLDGRPVVPQEQKHYLMLNKPAGYLCAMSDPEKRPLAVDLLKDACAERVYNVGRLDQWSSGLILFTNDGDFAKKMSHPSSNIEKEYELVTDVAIPKEFAVSFEAGVVIDETTYKARSVKILDDYHATIILIEGRNREIRRVLAHFGLRALKLTRVRIGPVRLGQLPEGKFRELTNEELRTLSDLLGWRIDNDCCN